MTYKNVGTLHKRGGTQRRAVVAGAAVALILGIGVFILFRTTVRNELTVVNLSGVPLESLEVSLPWQSLQFGRLSPGASLTRTFSIEHDAGFEVSGKLEDGTPVRDSNGYVTNGQFGQKIRVEIERNGSVRFSQDADAT